MKQLNKIIQSSLIDLDTIDDRLQAIKDALGADEVMSWKYNQSKFKISSWLSDANFDAVEAIFAADEEAARDDVSNTDRKSKLHRAHKATKAAIQAIADSDIKTALQKLHDEVHLLEE